jgi:peptide/nickel transport system substrate-binding protein
LRVTISRREFLSTTLALGLALPAATALAGKALAAEPKRGGRVRLGLGLGSTTDTLDPATYNDTYMQVVGFGFRNCLTEVNNDDELIPELAESWEASDDATQWTFKLRKGVEFHSGKTLDAEDVIASVAHHRGEASKSPAKGILAPIAEMKADGSETVVFKLNEGNADFPFLLSDYHIGICPAKDGDLDWQLGDGTVVPHPQPELLQGGPSLLRRGGGALHHRRERPHLGPHHGRGRRHRPGRPQDRRSPRQDARRAP